MPDNCTEMNGCPGIQELESGDFAVTGTSFGEYTEITNKERVDLLNGTGEGEWIVILPRPVLLEYIAALEVSRAIELFRENIGKELEKAREEAGG